MLKTIMLSLLIYSCVPAFALEGEAVSNLQLSFPCIGTIPDLSATPAMNLNLTNETFRVNNSQSKIEVSGLEVYVQDLSHGESVYLGTLKKRPGCHRSINDRNYYEPTWVDIELDQATRVELRTKRDTESCHEMQGGWWGNDYLTLNMKSLTQHQEINLKWKQIRYFSNPQSCYK